MIGVGRDEEDEVGREMSQSLIVLSNEPEATQFCLGLLGMIS